MECENPAFWLVHLYHVTKILDSDWLHAIPAPKILSQDFEPRFWLFLISLQDMRLNTESRFLSQDFESRFWLFLISLQDMRLNTEFNRWPITSMKRMDFKSYIPSCWRPPFWNVTKILDSDWLHAIPAPITTTQPAHCVRPSRQRNELPLSYRAISGCKHETSLGSNNASVTTFNKMSCFI